MRIRKTRRQDFKQIDEIYRGGHDEKFALPNLDKSITHAVIEHEGVVIAFGIVKLYAEAVAVLDQRQPRLDRIEALTVLLTEAFRACEDEGLEQLHVYVQDPLFQRLLEQKFDFKPATGVALVKEFSNGERRGQKDKQDA